jgi:hypothetical protein
MTPSVRPTGWMDRDVDNESGYAGTGTRRPFDPTRHYPRWTGRFKEGSDGRYRRIPAEGSLTGSSEKWGIRRTLTSEFVKASDRGFQITNCKSIDDFEIRLYIHSQFVIRHLESIFSQPLSASRE